MDDISIRLIFSMEGEELSERIDWFVYGLDERSTVIGCFANGGRMFQLDSERWKVRNLSYPPVPVERSDSVVRARAPGGAFSKLRLRADRLFV